MKTLLGFAAWVVPSLTVVIGLGLIVTDSHSGFIPDLGTWLGVWLLALGNIASLVLNGVFWLAYRRPAWLRPVLFVQALPALFAIGVLVDSALSDARATEAFEQRRALSEAIEGDDVAAVQSARGRCNQRCQDSFPPASQLGWAANHSADRVAFELLDENPGLRVAYGAGSWQFETCDGATLFASDALTLAVIRGDSRLVERLLPRSDEGSRRAALWTAARLDRLALVHQLLDGGVPLSIRGPILDENETLLVAAAEGGAVETGRWLLEAQHLPVDAPAKGPDPYPGESPVHALLREPAGSAPRSRAFLGLLVSHGVDLDAPLKAGGTLLGEAAGRRNLRAVRLLLDAGADPALLDAEQRAALDELLARPEREDVSGPSAGCIGVGP